MRSQRASSLRRLLWTAAIAALALAAPAGPRGAAAASPTAFPASNQTDLTVVTGRVVALATGQIAVLEDGAASPVAFHVAADAAFTREGYNAGFDELRRGDRIQMTVDGTTGTIVGAAVEPASGGFGAPSGELALLAAIGLIGAGCVLAIRLRSGVVTAPGGRAAAAPWSDRLPALDVRHAPVALSSGRVRR